MSKFSFRALQLGFALCLLSICLICVVVLALSNFSKGEHWRECMFVHDGKFMLYYIEPHVMFVVPLNGDGERQLPEFSTTFTCKSRIRVRGNGDEGEQMTLADTQFYLYAYESSRQKAVISLFGDIKITVDRGKTIEVNGKRYDVTNSIEPTVFVFSGDGEVEIKKRFPVEILDGFEGLGYWSDGIIVRGPTKNSF